MRILLVKNIVEQVETEGDDSAHPEDDQVHVPGTFHKVVEQNGAASCDQKQDLKLGNHLGPRRELETTEHKPAFGPHDF